MQIHNGTRSEVTAFEQGEWHHTGVFGLVEFSAPIDLSDRCPGGASAQWQTTQIQQTFLQGLAQALTWGFYSPWDVNVQCGRTKS